MTPTPKFAALSKIFHERARLGIMSTLVTRPAGVDFNELLNGLGLSKGNLVIHLRKLEEAGYVRVRRGFVGRMRRTVYTATKRGRRDFSSYLELLEEIIRDVRSREEGP